MKTILATGELPTYSQVYQASLACMMAGADFIKTSTGKEPTNATIPVYVPQPNCGHMPCLLGACCACSHGC